MEHWHLTFAAPDRPTLLSSNAAVLAAARTLVRVSDRSAALFCIVDDHGHAVVRGSRAHAGRVAGWLLQGLTPLVNHRFEPARIRPINGRAHLENLIGYVCDQTSHHELQLGCHPALWPGSCFQDLVGARLLPGFEPELLRQALPRLTEAELWGALRLPIVLPATNELLEHAGPAAVASAALAAAGESAFEGRSSSIGQARRVTAFLGRTLGWDGGTVARLIRTTPRAGRRLATQPFDPRLEHAVRLQVALQRHCLAHGALPDPGRRSGDQKRVRAAAAL